MHQKGVSGSSGLTQVKKSPNTGEENLQCRTFRATSLQHKHILVIPAPATLSYTLSYGRSITSFWYAIKVSHKVKKERQKPSESWEWTPENWNTLWLSLQLLLNQLIAGPISIWWTVQRDGRFALTSGVSAHLFSLHCREEPHLGAESTGLESHPHTYTEGFQKLIFCTESLNLVSAKTTCMEVIMAASKTAGISAF